VVGARVCSSHRDIQSKLKVEQRCCGRNGNGWFLEGAVASIGGLSWEDSFPRSTANWPKTHSETERLPYSPKQRHSPKRVGNIVQNKILTGLPPIAAGLLPLSSQDSDSDRFNGVLGRSRQNNCLSLTLEDKLLVYLSKRSSVFTLECNEWKAFEGPPRAAQTETTCRAIQAGPRERKGVAPTVPTVLIAVRRRSPPWCRPIPSRKPSNHGTAVAAAARGPRWRASFRRRRPPLLRRSGNGRLRSGGWRGDVGGLGGVLEDAGDVELPNGVACAGGAAGSFLAAWAARSLVDSRRVSGEKRREWFARCRDENKTYLGPVCDAFRCRVALSANQRSRGSPAPKECNSFGSVSRGRVSQSFRGFWCTGGSHARCNRRKFRNLGCVVCPSSRDPLFIDCFLCALFLASRTFDG